MSSAAPVTAAPAPDPGGELAADILDGTVGAAPPAVPTAAPTAAPSTPTAPAAPPAAARAATSRAATSRAPTSRAATSRAATDGERAPRGGREGLAAAAPVAAPGAAGAAALPGWAPGRRNGAAAALAGAVRSGARAAAAPVALFLLAIAVWGWWVAWRDVPGYLLPSPAAVAETLRADPGRYAEAAAVTLGHAAGGLAAGSGTAFLLAIAMAHWRVAERAIYPVAILVKVTPVVAVAPLVVIWFGFGYWPKIVVAGLITFFPMLVNAVTGLRSVDPQAADFLRSMDASRWQMFRVLRLPGSVPYVFAALRISVPLSLIGAVVAEWTAADSGMGQVIVIAHGDLDTAALFAAIAVLAVVGVAASGVLALVEHRLLFWHESQGGP